MHDIVGSVNGVAVRHSSRSIPWMAKEGRPEAALNCPSTMPKADKVVHPRADAVSWPCE